MKWGLEHIFESEDINHKYINTKKRKKAKAKETKEIYIDFALKNKLVLEAFKKLEGEKK
ncbi:hypothetical protein [Aliarcobacter skirrowii]|uniref:hypothetical protein n=1 Tax=Aliarcobacter skirrowii TaxID=28200 RepID=UPI000B07044F|nr:hypothetical protein [Aliarcobacter skirrowii]